MTVSHLVLKCAGTVVLFGITVLFGLLPLKFIKSQNQEVSYRQKTFVGLCNCFAGGVFFSTCLLDLLPLVREKINEALQEVDIYTHYPLGEFIASVGFILMLAIELLVHSLGKDGWLGEHAHAGRDMDDLEHAPLLQDGAIRDYGAQDSSKSPVKSHSSKSLTNSNIAEHQHLHDDKEIVDDVEGPAAPDVGDGVMFIANPGCKNSLRRSKSLRSLVSTNVVVHSSFRIYILIIALSLHSLFEGLSVGLVTDVNTLIQILIALLIHKSILSFALGVKLVDGGLVAKQVVIGNVIFAAMAPIGVGLGLAVLSSSSRVVSLFFSGILQGIATGSFLYVTFFEILPEEFNISRKNKGRKVLSVLLGFLIIAGMCYYENQFHRIRKIVPSKINAEP